MIWQAFKDLYHKLAHNVHSEHDTNFSQLMRQIERECNDLDWTQAAGLNQSDGSEDNNGALYTTETYRLGGGNLLRVSPSSLSPS
jgi:hypothetical protein